MKLASFHSSTSPSPLFLPLLNMSEKNGEKRVIMGLVARYGIILGSVTFGIKLTKWQLLNLAP